MAISKEARRKEILTKVVEAKITHRIPWQNRHEELPVITVSLNSILLNPFSHRIRSQIESSPQLKLLEEEPFGDPAQDIIAEFLRQTLEFEDLKDNLGELGQDEAGVITREGVLINANTRAVALRDLGEQYIDVGVLPESAQPAEYFELEARLQMAKSFQQDYTLTNRLLFIQEQRQAGVTAEDLVVLMGKAPSRDEKHLKIGKAEIERDLRILARIRDLQQTSGGGIPLTYFDEHESALAEADKAAERHVRDDPGQADRVWCGHLLGTLAGVPYRDLRKWDSDEFADKYIVPQLAVVGELDYLALTEDLNADSGENLGLDAFGSPSTFDPQILNSRALMVQVAQRYREDDPSTEIEPGITRQDFFDGLRQRISEAAFEKQQAETAHKRSVSPITAIRDAHAAVGRAVDALPTASKEKGFKQGELKYWLNRLSKAVESLKGTVDI